MNATTEIPVLKRGVFGGGGWFNNELESLPRLKRAMDITGKSRPRLLVMPTPSTEPQMDELNGLRALFGRSGRYYRTLTKDTQEMPSYEQAEELLDWSDVTLNLGGDFAELMLR